jgi:hypothetical protein
VSPTASASVNTSLPRPRRGRTLTRSAPRRDDAGMGLTRERWGRGRNTRVITAAVIVLAAVAVILLASL